MTTNNSLTPTRLYHTCGHKLMQVIQYSGKTVFVVLYDAELTSASCGESIHSCPTCQTSLFSPHSMVQQWPPLSIKDNFSQADILTMVKRLKKFLNTTSNTISPAPKKALLKLCRAAERKLKNSKQQTMNNG